PFAALHDGDELPPQKRPTPATPVEQLRFVALDCETTGQSPHHLVELGAVAFTVDRHLLSFETLVHSNDRINPYARRIHGISRENLHGAPPVGRVVERFRRFVRGSVLVEHSADAFDTRLIARTIGAALDADNLDTTRLAAKVWDLRDTIGLERLCQQLGVTHRRPHHALADAEATAACFLGLLRVGRDRFGWHTLGALLADGQPPPLRISDQMLQRERHAGDRHSKR
ncbi:MAG: 3'-5' exonuclease, partial [Candidatus Dormibacteria bacterium]